LDRYGEAPLSASVSSGTSDVPGHPRRAPVPVVVRIHNRRTRVDVSSIQLDAVDILVKSQRAMRRLVYLAAQKELREISPTLAAV
jgi:hypothetical protein